MDTVREALEKINIRCEARYDEPLSGHTSFRIGGPADCYVYPERAEDVARLLDFAGERGLDARVWGGGTNVLVSDSGLRGIVIDLSRLNLITREATGLYAQAGTPFDALCDAAAGASLSGLEFAAGLPGSVGGAAYMNARCYDGEIADVLERADILFRGSVRSVAVDPKEWGYKKSPFQSGGAWQGAVILGAAFSLKQGDASLIGRESEEKRRDRTAKGHYLYPCAGSVFKNDRAFGEPTGRILDRLGFRGMRLRSAAVAEYHANIFINPGRATARDMKALIELAEERAFSELGFRLEREVILLGDFS